MLAKVQVQTVGDRVAAVGTGRAVRSLTLTSEVPGVIEEIRFKPGESVKAGQELLKLQSEAEEIAVKLAQVKVDEADVNLKRLQGLVERNAVPTVQVDTARTALALARTDLEAKQYELRRRTVRAPFDGIMGLTVLGKGGLPRTGRRDRHDRRPHKPTRGLRRLRARRQFVDARPRRARDHAGAVRRGVPRQDHGARHPRRRRLAHVARRGDDPQHR